MTHPVDALVVDFDAHFSALTRALVTAAGATCSTVLAEDLTLGVIEAHDPRCLILCATSMQSPLLVMSSRIAMAGRPLLGICNGAQLIAESAGGAIGSLPRAEEGLVKYLPGHRPVHGSLALPMYRRSRQVFMHHWMVVTELPPGATTLGSTRLTRHAAFYIPASSTHTAPAVGIQYHPEVATSRWSYYLHARALRGYLAAARNYRGVSRHPGERRYQCEPLFTPRAAEQIDSTPGPSVL